MRIFPILTSVAVAIALYFIVMQREAITLWLDGGAAAETQTADAGNAPETADPGDGVISVVVLHSQEQDIPDGLVLRGRTEAARRLNVLAETSGRVISEPIRKGAVVGAGDVLCRLDPGTRPEQLAQARAQMENARVTLANAEELASGGFGPQTAVIAARAALEAARAGVARIEQDIANLEITAPFGGVLESDTAELGSLIQPGAPCASILALDEIRLVGFATEQDIDRISLGARAAARLVSGREVTGRVSFLSRSSDPVTRTFRVEVTVPNPDLSIRDGETAEMVIEMDRVRAHLLPNNALTLNDEGVLGVRTVSDGITRFLPVRILRDSADGLWLEGLPETVDVIVVGQEFVVDGTPVHAVPQEAAQ